MITQSKVRSYSESARILASTSEVFNFIDDHNKFSSHMNTSSMMMGGGKMNTYVDKLGGKALGSHIKMDGQVFGIPLSLDEVITRRVPPFQKAWKTVGTPKLLVIGQYQMEVKIVSGGEDSQLTVSIDYELPKSRAWIGKLLSGWYAKWCVRQMLFGVQQYFIHLHGSKIMKHNALATANASAVTVGFFYITCRILVGFFPGLMFSVAQSLLHGMELTQVGSWNLSASNFILGLLTSMVSAWIIGLIFAFSYNSFAKK